MKNIVYYAFDKAYLNCFKQNLNLLRKYNPNIDVCCIIPENYELDVKKFIVKDLNLKYKAKYSIVEWEKFDDYDNFLYLDSDAFVIKPLDDIFSFIYNNPFFIHGVKEKNSINISDRFFRITKTKCDEGPAYNAGTFGFNKIQKNVLKELISFIDQNFENTVCEQPHFNEFLSCRKKLLVPSLSKYINLGGYNSLYKDINIVSVEKSSIVHYLGGFGNPDNGNIKLNAVLKELKKFL